MCSYDHRGVGIQAEKNSSSTMRSPAGIEPTTYPMRCRSGVGSIPAGVPIFEDEFCSTLPSLKFDMCMISARIKTHFSFKMSTH